jgi:hypothetical protein
MAILDKHFNNVLIGNNSLSCMLGIGLLKSQKKILLIEDERLHYGRLYSQNLGELEKNFLEVFGKDEGLDPLINVSQFLRHAPLRFCVERSQLLLGRKPWQNLVELNRKFPELFDGGAVEYCQEIMSDKSLAEQFDELFYATSKRIATSAVRVDGIEQLNFNLFLNQCPEKIKVFFDAFKKQVMSKDFVAHLYLWRSYYQQQMTRNLAELELFHLMLSLLAPRYELNETSLNAELLELCRQHGGQFKSTSVREWKFHNRAPWCIELASFDGIIHPEMISFFGSGFEKTPFRAAESLERYRGLNLTWKLDPSILERLKGQRIMGTQYKDLGTDGPWWMVDFHAESMDILVPISHEPGLKTDFVLKNLRVKLKDWLRPWIGDYEKHLLHESVELGPEIWVSSDRDPRFQGIGLVDASGPGQKKLLRNVYYYGPLNKRSMGLFSGLVAIKEAKNFA